MIDQQTGAVPPPILGPTFRKVRNLAHSHGRSRGANTTWNPENWVIPSFAGLFGGNERALVERYLGWKFTSRQGQSFAGPKEPRRTPAGLVKAVKIADAANIRKGARLRSLEHLPKSAVHDVFSPAAVEERLRRIRAEGGDLALAAALEFAVAASPATVLEKMVRESFLPITERWPDASMWLVKVSSFVGSRVAVYRAALAVEQFPEILEGLTLEQPRFESSAGQMSSYLGGLTTFLEPSLTMLAPGILGVIAERPEVSVVVLFGEVIEGRSRYTPGSILGLRGSTNFASAGVADLKLTPLPQYSSLQIERWFKWWVGRVDALITELVDPRPYADDQRKHQPLQQIATLMTLDRLFTNAGNGLALTGRNEYVRKVLSFASLDALEMLGGPDRTALLRSRLVEAAADRVREAGEQTAIAGPRMESAASGLAKVANGFFIPSRRRVGRIEVAQDRGGTAWISEEDATAQYVNLVRNGTHGYRDFLRKPHLSSLLESHNGNLPDGVADVPIVHLLDLLVDPPGKLSGTKPGPRLR